MENIDYLKIAAAHAEKNKGQSFPNPTVGCVIVSNGQIIAKASTARGGSPHAEKQALDIAGSKAKNADLYVTLEPCSHYGKNPPCVNAIIDAGIKRVFYALSDPNPLVNNKGISKLKDAGIETHLLEITEVTKLHQEFCYLQQYNKPYVRVKIALSQDNKTAYKNNHEQWITGLESRSDVHLLRYKADAILTSSATVLADNPQLNVRITGLQKFQETILLLDSKLRIPLDSNLVSNAAEKKQKLIIFTNKESDFHKKEELKQSNVTIVEVAECGGKLDLKEILNYCAQQQIANLLVEAGASLSKAFIDQQLAQELVIYKSDKILGESGVGEFAFDDFTSLKNRKIGNDQKYIIKL